MNVNICGIPYTIEEVPVIDEELDGITQGKILYSQAKILLKESLPKELKQAVLFHEIVHGILMNIGYSELAGDETFVQGLSNALYQMFKLKMENDIRVEYKSNIPLILGEQNEK